MGRFVERVRREVEDYFAGRGTFEKLGAAVWAKTKLLIWGKTYPEFSAKHYETVCTGALDPQTGRLVRIYPIKLRHMKDPFHAYDWVEAEVERNEADFRPESHRIRENTIEKVGELGTSKTEWAERARLILGPNKSNVFASVEALVAAEKKDHTSLGLVRPREITRIYKRKKSETERKEWDEQRARALKQRDLFIDGEKATKELAFCPVQYRAKFTCDDPACSTEHDMGILDWGLYVLDYKQWAERGGGMAEEKVVEAIQLRMDPSKRDPYFFLGNTKMHPQNFMIVGLFHPPKAEPPKPTKGESMKLPGFE